MRISNKHITIITINWNSYAAVKICLLSLRSVSSEDVSVVVVDNGSVDGSGERLRREFPETDFIFNGRNLGFAAGVNVGIRKALKEGAEYVFLVNNDAEIEANTLGKLMDAINADKRNGIAGPRIFYAHNRQKVWQGGGYFRKAKMGVVSFDKNKVLDNGGRSRKVDFLSGCAMLIKKEVFEKIGLFDERFFFYAEDLDFCFNAEKAGFNVIYVPGASVFHDIKDIEETRTSPYVLYHLAKSYFLFIKKNFSFGWLIYGVLLFTFAYTPFRVYQIVKGGNKVSNIFSWLKGGYEGLSEASHEQ
ncbi:MAG: glycosyltransferase family 2 protein [Patescibacteria group bacterium]|nr:glycosyltransferase family 2 protein [Patescibacteria group bacterium]MCL5224325.1 glycosyltransferase family 2 protein [Patescibacteria group bacterium]